MLGGAREAHPERLGELANRLLAQSEVRKHPAPGRIGQSVKDRVELIINHLVEYERHATALSTIRLNDALFPPLPCFA